MDIQAGENGNTILSNVDSEGNILSEDIAVYDKNSEDTPFFNKCLEIQTNSIPVSPQKIFNPNKKIFGASCSPYVLAFYKRNLEKYSVKIELVKKELDYQYFKIKKKIIKKKKKKI